MNLHQRILQVMKSVSYIQKEQKRGMQYSVVSHDAVTAKLRPSIIEAGIVYYPVSTDLIQEGNRTECLVTVRFVNSEKPEEYIDVPSAGYGIDSQDKGPGKAISYAIKYALLKTFALETGDDPDLDQQVVHEPAPKPKQAQAPKPKQQEMAKPEALDDARWGTAERIAGEMMQQITSTTTHEELEAWFNESKDQRVKLKQAFPAISKKLGEHFTKHKERLNK
jgi:hypothetical protein